jgi:adenylate cyclase
LSSTEQRRLAAIMFTDMVGYSALSQHNEDLALELLEEHRRIVRAALSRHRGREVKTMGDGFLLEFPSALAAVQAAVEFQQALHDRNQAAPGAPPILLRVGIHVGDVVASGGDIHGDGVNIASRLEPLAPIGGICVSNSVFDQVRNKLPLPLEAMGPSQLKNISLPVAAYRVVLPWSERSEVEAPRAPKKSRAALVTTLALLVAAGVLLAWRPWLALRSPRATTVTNPQGPPNVPAQSPEPTAPEKSIAVLPFENRSSEKENEYFADGVQDEILSDLARIGDLKVISRSSVMQYKSGVPRNLREIAPALGVTYILEGSVQRADGKVRVTAQLIDARTDRHLWAEHYDRNLADVFAIQSEIAERIAGQLKARLSDSEKAAILERPTADLQAYELYLRARKKREETVSPSTIMAENEEVIRLLNDAVARDPNYLAAWALLEELHDQAYRVGYDHSEARRALAGNAVDHAVQLRPDAGETHVAQARHFYYGYRDYDRAQQHLAAARAVLPNSWDVVFFTAVIDRRQGNWDQSNRNLEQALEINPLSLTNLHELAWSYSFQRRYGDLSRIAARIDKLEAKDPFEQRWTPLVALERDANPGPLLARINEQIATNPHAIPPLAPILMVLGLNGRDVALANRALSMLPQEIVLGIDNERYPRAYFSALTAQLANQPALAREQFALARAAAAARVAAQPDDAHALAVLALIDAGLGQKEDAMSEARRASEMLPISRDAFDGPYLKYFLAEVAAKTGENDAALTVLEALAHIPSPVNYGDLQLATVWDPLRQDPRFKTLIAQLAPAAGSAKQP